MSENRKYAKYLYGDAKVLIGEDDQGNWFCRVYKKHTLVAYKHDESLFKCLLLLNPKTHWRYKRIDAIMANRGVRQKRELDKMLSGEIWEPRGLKGLRRKFSKLTLPWRNSMNDIFMWRAAPPFDLGREPVPEPEDKSYEGLMAAYEDLYS